MFRSNAQREEFGAGNEWRKHGRFTRAARDAAPFVSCPRTPGSSAAMMLFDNSEMFHSNIAI
jgi:hypothetical protein